jgi:hypothetical protein
MKRFLALCMILSMAVVFTGCDKKAEVKTEKKVTTPEGTTKTTESTKVEKSGDNPPPADAK